MKKLYSLLLYIMLSVVLFAQGGPSIPIVHFDNTSKYAPGSGVSIVINPTGVFEIDNQFTLELLNSSGSVVSTLSTVDEFYVPVLNGTLPSNLSPGKYKLRIKSTKPNNVEITSEEFDVISGSAITKPIITSTLESGLAALNCTNNFGLLTFGIIDKASGSTTSDIDEMDRKLSVKPSGSTTLQIISISSGEKRTITNMIPEELPIGTYIIEATSSNGNIVSKNTAVFLCHGNATTITNTSSENVCVFGDVNFNVETGADGIGRNYPASKYILDFGDGTIQI